MVMKDTWAPVQNSFKYNHFTVLGLMAADGCAIICVVIIAASRLEVMDVTGFIPLSKDAEDTSSNKMKVLEDEIEAMTYEHSNGVDHTFWTTCFHLNQHAHSMGLMYQCL
jgi:hypothetical protein